MAAGDWIKREIAELREMQAQLEMRHMLLARQALAITLREVAVGNMMRTLYKLPDIKRKEDYGTW